MPRGIRQLGKLLCTVTGMTALLLAALAILMWVRCHWATDSIWMARRGVTAEIMTARNGCLVHWSTGGVERGGRHLYTATTQPSDLIRGNWRFWTGSTPRQLLGVIIWGRANYGGNERGLSILLPYWLLACAAAAIGAGLLMIARRLHQKDLRRRSGQCIRCGYDLRATPDRCPECGTITRLSTGQGSEASP